MIDFLEEMVCNTNLLPTEHKAAAAVLRTISKDTTDLSKTDLTTLLQPIEVHNGYIRKTYLFFILMKYDRIGSFEKLVR